MLLVLVPGTLFAQPLKDSQLQNEVKNKASMQRFYEEVWNTGNVAVVDEVFAETYLPHDTTVQKRLKPEIRDEQKKLVIKARSMFTEFSFKPDFFVAEGDVVVGHWKLSGKPNGLISIISANQIEFSGVNTFRFADGRVVEIWNNRDDLRMYQQLGFVKLLFGGGFMSALILCLLFWLILKFRKKLITGRQLQTT